ncbi:hypothetical protein [Streptomyces sp. NPDC015131]|uniref:hypothetical protein n=1 Tax=Streptomyces sp. NPDC015131 TaxID=3364941 RepID=UPI0036F5315D
MSKPVQGGLTAAALVLIPVLAIGGSDSFRAALDFTTGVLSLVSLTASVAWGLIATDRLLLSTRHRLLAQAIHRTTAVASLGFLLLHATVKVSLGHVALIGALVPFGLGVTGTSGLIGFGSLAGLLMVVAASTGAARSALAGRGSIAARWRPLHMLAYPAWCCALVHGLYAGRPAATWVTAMYCLALTGVATAVSVRLLPRPTQQRLAERVLGLLGPGTEKAGTRGARRRRDPSVSPLPGASDMPPPSYDPSPPFEQELRREPRTGPEPPSRPASPPTAAQDRFLGRPREQPTLTPPSAPLYEPSFPPPAPGAATRTRRAGISAAYRAMSRNNAAPGPATAPAAGGPTEEIPYAERVPMTEELPVVTDEPATRPGYWPTPSPPPPTPSPAPRAYHPETPPPSSYGQATSAPGPSPYGQGDPSSPYGQDATPPPFPGPGVSPPPYGEPRSSEPAPGPFQQPPAGEPWTAPAGDRP